MKKIAIIAVMLCVSFLAKGQTDTENYIKTTSYQIATQDGNVGDDAKIEGVTYADGLGRPVQQIAVRAGGNRENIVTYMEYDDLGMQTKQYLPFATTNQLPSGSALNFMNDTLLNPGVISQFYVDKYGDGSYAS